MGLINPILNWLPEEDADKMLGPFLSKVPDMAAHLTKRLPDEGPFFGGASPHFAEFMLFVSHKLSEQACAWLLV